MIFAVQDNIYMVANSNVHSLLYMIHLYISSRYTCICIQAHLYMNQIFLPCPWPCNKIRYFIMAFLFRTVWNALITSFYSSTPLKKKTSPSFVDWKNVRLASAVCGLANVMLLKCLIHLLAYLSKCSVEVIPF